MAAAARFFIRGAHSKLSFSGIGTGAQSSFGATLLKSSPGCSSRTKTQRRHAAHFTFQPDPVTTQYGEGLASRLTLATLTGETCVAVEVSTSELLKRQVAWQHCEQLLVRKYDMKGLYLCYLFSCPVIVPRSRYRFNALLLNI